MFVLGVEGSEKKKCPPEDNFWNSPEVLQTLVGRTLRLWQSLQTVVSKNVTWLCGVSACITVPGLSL